jgi:dephospho-CoA kinase
MLRVGLTGNIGSGKSIVARIFAILGVPVYHADQEARKFLSEPAIISQIASFFGQNVVSASGEIDRTALGNLAFSDPGLLNALNSLLHPLVMKDFAAWCSGNNSHRYIIQEAAILLESGYKESFDRVVHVSCPPEVSIDRVIRRDNVSRSSVLDRMKYQFEDLKKAALSDFIIRNDGLAMVIPQVLSIHHDLLQVTA